MKTIFATLILATLIHLPARADDSSVPAIPAAAVIHNGNGKWELTAGLIRSGLDAAHPNVYQNYTVHKGMLTLANLQHVMVVGCDIGGFGPDYCVLLNNCTDVWVCGNKIHDDNGGGVGSYPTVLVNCHVDGNVFSNVGESIHLDFGSSGQSQGCSVSYNVIPTTTRYTIELQGDSAAGLKVLHNYCGSPGLRGDVSIATQSSPPSDASGQPVPGGVPSAYTKGNEIAYNTIFGGAPSAAQPNGGGGLEIYGAGANVHDNTFVNANAANPGIYWSATGWLPNTPWTITHNTFIGVSNPWSYEGFLPAVNLAPTTSGNRIFATNDPKAPPVPTIAQTLATAGGAMTQPTTRASADQPAVPPFAAVAQVDGVHVSNLPGNAGTLTWTADGNTGVAFANPTLGQTGNVSVPAGATTALITSIPNNWEAVLTFSGLPGTSVIVRANTAQQFPAVSPPNPSTEPAAVLIGHSRDGVTWTVDATVQP